MDRDELLQEITTEDIKQLMKQLGSSEPIPDHQGHLYFQTICHCGDKHKLMYYPDSKNFMCYTNCGSMSLYDLISQINNVDFKTAFKYIADFKGVDLHNKRAVGLQNRNVCEDMEILHKHLSSDIPKQQLNDLAHFDKNVLHIFSSYYPDTWANEGINEDIAKYFGIGFYFNQFKCTIPHYDKYGGLVGIRGRNFLQREIDQGRKYIPMTIQGLTYRYPTAMNLYGLYQNQNNIKKAHKVILFESEKSVLKYASIYGQNNNITLATMSMNLTKQQRLLLMELDIDEVIIAWDKQYKLEYLTPEYKHTREYREFVQYVHKLQKAVGLLMHYFNVSIMLCWDQRLQYKDAPIDQGRIIFEELLDERYLIENIEELEELIN